MPFIHEFFPLDAFVHTSDIWCDYPHLRELLQHLRSSREEQVHFMIKTFDVAGPAAKEIILDEFIKQIVPLEIGIQASRDFVIALMRRCWISRNLALILAPKALWLYCGYRNDTSITIYISQCDLDVVPLLLEQDCDYSDMVGVRKDSPDIALPKSVALAVFEKYKAATDNKLGHTSEYVGMARILDAADLITDDVPSLLKLRGYVPDSAFRKYVKKYGVASLFTEHKFPHDSSAAVYAIPYMTEDEIKHFLPWRRFQGSPLHAPLMDHHEFYRRAYFEATPDSELFSVSVDPSVINKYRKLRIAAINPTWTSFKQALPAVYEKLTAFYHDERSFNKMWHQQHMPSLWPALDCLRKKKPSITTVSVYKSGDVPYEAFLTRLMINLVIFIHEGYFRLKPAAKGTPIAMLCALPSMLCDHVIHLAFAPQLAKLPRLDNPDDVIRFMLTIFAFD